MAPKQVLESGGKKWGTTGDGSGQGDPASGAFQTIAMQPSLERLDAELGAVGGVARGGADDVYAIGPPAQVFAAIARFEEDLFTRCHLTLQRSKSVVYCPGGELPESALPGFKLAGEKVDNRFLTGLMVYGVPVGSPEYVTYKLKMKAKEIISDAEKAMQVLSQDRQALWSALRLSIQQRFEYLMKLVAPSLCKPVAKELDTALWKILEAACGFKVPKGDGGLLLRLQAVHSLDLKSFQEWVVRQPVRLYGWGLRSLEDLCGPAYIGTLETALPFMAGRESQLCPQLADLWGGKECWGEGEDEKKRWRKVMESGCKEGVELTTEWGVIRLEAMQCAKYLQEEVPEVFKAIAVGVGEGSVSGATRTKVVEAAGDCCSCPSNKAGFPCSEARFCKNGLDDNVIQVCL